MSHLSEGFEGTRGGRETVSLVVRRALRKAPVLASFITGTRLENQLAEASIETDDMKVL